MLHALRRLPHASSAMALWLALGAAQPAMALIGIEETFDPLTGGGAFGVYNGTTENVVAFAVANDTATTVDGLHELYGSWAAGIITETNWNADKAVFELALGQPIPDFTTAFPGYNQAVVYWAHDLLAPAEQGMVEAIHWEFLDLRDPVNEDCLCYHSRPIMAGDDALISTYGVLGFYFQASAAASPFLALTDGLNFYAGNTVHFPAVPEPGTALMLLAGLGLAGWRLRQRR